MPRNAVMPPELRHLYQHGQLLAEDAIANDWLPVMKCSRCGANTDLIYVHGAQNMSKRKFPGTVWGKDVLVLCRCCSRPGCNHAA